MCLKELGYLTHTAIVNELRLVLTRVDFDSEICDAENFQCTDASTSRVTYKKKENLKPDPEQVVSQL